MSRPSDEKKRARRGYALITIVVVTVLIVLGAGVLLVIGKESEITGINQKRETEAYGAAMAGVQWMLANLSDTEGQNLARSVAKGTATVIAPFGVTLHPFNGNDRYAGVGVAPPAVGVSNTHWTAFGEGHYGLLAAVDTLDRNRSVLIRAIGIVRGMQVVLEANLQLNFLEQVSGALIGCFADDFQIRFYDQEGPYDYVGNFRIDGAGGVPFGMSADHNRMNGLARSGASSTPAADPSYVQGRIWRGTQSLRGGALASGVSNLFGGVQGTNQIDTGLGPSGLWLMNPYISNDPRIADAFTFDAKGLALGAGGFVFTGAAAGGIINDATATRQRGLPLIAFIDGPSVVANSDGGFLAQSVWGGRKDDDARKGFYACDNHGAGNTINGATEACVKGSLGDTGPNWTNAAVNHSGRAWGFIQSIHRQCTGSGSSIDPNTGSPFLSAANPNGIKCAPGFEWLENVAACLILPQTIAKNQGTNALRPTGDGVGTNNFEGCHPGCLIATDIDGNNSIGNEDRPFRSVCINLDASTLHAYGPGALIDKGTGSPFTDARTHYGTSWKDWNISKGIVDAGDNTTGARFADAGGVIRPAGAIAELGNGQFITRLDMSDRGPLGTCEQNCLAFGWGKDVTYGAHRTDIGSPGVQGTQADPSCVARVPDLNGGTKLEVCNMDYDNDGFLDRKTYALISAYREECADPRDGLAWAPTFNISSSNTNIVGGCVNDLPNFVKRPPPVSDFCEGGQDSALREAIDEIRGQAKSVSTDVFNKNGSNLTDGDGWFGGARCHMGDQRFGGDALTHPHTGNIAALPDTDVDRLGHPDYWIEDSCPNPVVIRLATNANVNVGKVCGCGVVIFNDNTLMFNNQSTFLWRGLVLWDMKTAGKELRISGSGAGTFVVEGATLLTGVQGMQFNVQKNVASGNSVTNPANGETVKMSFRNNPRAIADAFRAIQPPVRGVRRLQ
jgi:hypothetical protein